MQRGRNWKPTFRKTFAGLCLLLVVTWVCEKTDPLPETTGFLLLLSILIIATFGDLWVAIVLSLAAVMSFLWFLPPANSFAIDGGPAWIAVAVFLTTAVIGSQLSVRAQRRAREAEDRNMEMERIHALGRALLSHDTLEATAEAAVWHIVHSLGATNAVLYVLELQGTRSVGEIAGVEPLLRQVFKSGEPWSGEAASPKASERVTVSPLNSGEQQIGALAIQAGQLSENAIFLTVNLVSVALGRASATEKAVEAGAISRNEELRRAMVDAFAHNLKTPLTSIKASTSALLRRSGAVSEDTRELLTVVDEETDRLTKLIADSLELVRLGGGVTPAREIFPIAQAVRAAIASVERNLEKRQLQVKFPAEIPMVAADPHLIELVITQLLDNALKYSPPDSPIGVRVSVKDDQVSVAVENHGLAIDEDERDRIFDKFYRGRKNLGRIEGTGMGLSIARTIVESHDGRIAVHNEPEDLIVFEFCLPLAPVNNRENVTT